MLLSTYPPWASQMRKSPLSLGQSDEEEPRSVEHRVVRVASLAVRQRVECGAGGIVQGRTGQQAGPPCADVEGRPLWGCMRVPETAGQAV